MHGQADPAVDPNLVVRLSNPDHPTVSSAERELEDGVGLKDKPGVKEGGMPVSKAPRRTTRKRKAASPVTAEVTTIIPAAIGPDGRPLKGK